MRLWPFPPVAKKTEAGNPLIFSDTAPSLPSFCAKFGSYQLSIYPVGTGSVSIRRTMLLNNRRVR
jgi:hypothetical protein